MAIIDPEITRFLESLSAEHAAPIQTLAPAAARAGLVALQARQRAQPPAEIEDRRLPVGPTGAVDVRIVRPAGARGPLPGILYLHGGGWVIGDHDTHDRLIRELANGVLGAVVFVDYARAPEAHFPVAIEQAFAVTRWVADHGDELRIDRDRLALVGDSSGGNLAIAVAMLCARRGGPRIALQVLFYPATSAAMSTESYRQLAAGPWLTAEAMRWFWDLYAPDLATRNHPLVSPLSASLEELHGLPATVVITAEHDLLRDEGEAFASQLMIAEVPASAMRHLGAIHDFVLLDALADVPAARAAVAQAQDALRRAFTRAQPRTERQR
jgi:acetyl esterase